MLCRSRAGLRGVSVGASNVPRRMVPDAPQSIQGLRSPSVREAAVGPRHFHGSGGWNNGPPVRSAATRTAEQRFASRQNRHGSMDRWAAGGAHSCREPVFQPPVRGPPDEAARHHPPVGARVRPMPVQEVNPGLWRRASRDAPAGERTPSPIARPARRKKYAKKTARGSAPGPHEVKRERLMA